MTNIEYLIDIALNKINNKDSVNYYLIKEM